MTPVAHHQSCEIALVSASVEEVPERRLAPRLTNRQPCLRPSLTRAITNCCGDTVAQKGYGLAGTTGAQAGIFVGPSPAQADHAVRAERLRASPASLMIKHVRQHRVAE
jgi:hypothetical protein